MENKKIENIETPFTIAILVFYIALVNKFADVFFEKKDVVNHCANVKLDYSYKLEKEEYEKKMTKYKNCQEEKDIMKSEFENNKFLFLIVISVLSMLICSYLFNVGENKNYNSTFVGIIAGSLLTIIYQIFLNWNDINDNLKLVIYSASFVIIVIASGNYLN
jgi:uncharacterized membrane protein (DUF106 family)